MILSSDELEIVEYLKSWKGKPVGMLEVCRCAGGRRKFRETPHWAKGLMVRLVEAKLIEVNERGHYRYPVENETAMPTIQYQPGTKLPRLVGDDYFPVSDEPTVVGEDYFPSTAEPDAEDAEGKWWLSPHLLEGLKQSEEKKEG